VGATQLPTRHRLLAHERWFASLALERQRSGALRTGSSLEQSMGSEGFTLYTAALATFMPASLLVCAGFVLMVMSEGRGLLVEVARWVLFGGAALAAAALPRALQARRVARAFRSSRSP
jgi:hypothetical protein